MRRLVVISTLALLGGAAPAIAKPLHCKHGYVRHGHRCVHVKVPFKAPGAMQGSAPNLSLLEVEWAAYRAAHQIVPGEPPPLPRPTPPVEGPPRRPQAWTFTPGKITCETAGAPAGECLLNIAEPSVVAPLGHPPLGVEIEVEKQVLNSAGEVLITAFPQFVHPLRQRVPALLVKGEGIGRWNPHPFAPVPTSWWTEREGEPACISGTLPNGEIRAINIPCVFYCPNPENGNPEACKEGLIHPIFRERDPGTEASPTENNPIYLPEFGGGVVGLE